ncbi:hypothetical protein VPH35_110356 [Triticum aestivum]|uniref:putative F-box protein At2g02030 n=1 Tax=Triticum aestivum TaxID=4565 RepID=UPI0008432AC8|nr:putative F-box protein At2g02030 [Triticum aestivum]
MAIKRCADDPVSPRLRMAKRIVIKPPPPGFDQPDLPSDVIISILSWLPVKSLVRFKSVCRGWQAMLSEPGFIYAHLECSKKRRPSLLMVPCGYDPNDIQKNQDDSTFCMGFYRYHIGDKEELIHLQKLPQGIALWSSPLHCNGLILISTTREELMICNPATREFVTLPERKHERYAFPRVGFGFDPCSKKYKVARFFYQRLTPSYDLVCKFEVLTVGSNIWRQTVDPPYWICGQTPVHVNGYIYWTCAGNPSCPVPPKSFLRFSLTDEEFSLVPYPPSHLKPARFVQLESELSCVCLGFTKLDLEIWNLNFGFDQTPEWNRRWTTMISPDLIVELPQCRATRPPRVILHEDTWLLTEERNVYRYDTHTSEIVKISSGVQDTTYNDPTSQKQVILHLSNYAESLVQIR